jgi:hypothetical protein
MVIDLPNLFVGAIFIFGYVNLLLKMFKMRLCVVKSEVYFINSKNSS